MPGWRAGAFCRWNVLKWEKEREIIQEAMQISTLLVSCCCPRDLSKDTASFSIYLKMSCDAPMTCYDIRITQCTYLSLFYIL